MPRPWIGFAVRNNPGKSGLVIQDVSEGGPADLAGIIDLDQLEKFGGNNIGNIAEFRDALRSLVVGEVVSVEFVRGSQRLVTKLTVGQRETTDVNYKLPKLDTKADIDKVRSDPNLLHQATDSIFAMADEDCSGLVRKSEFIVAVKKLLPLNSEKDKKEILSMFKRLDKDDSGFLARSEFGILVDNLLQYASTVIKPTAKAKPSATSRGIPKVGAKKKAAKKKAGKQSPVKTRDIVINEPLQVDPPQVIQVNRGPSPPPQKYEYIPPPATSPPTTSQPQLPSPPPPSQPQNAPNTVVEYVYVPVYVEAPKPEHSLTQEMIIPPVTDTPLVPQFIDPYVQQPIHMPIPQNVVVQPGPMFPQQGFMPTFVNPQPPPQFNVVAPTYIAPAPLMPHTFPIPHHYVHPGAPHYPPPHLPPSPFVPNPHSFIHPGHRGPRPEYPKHVSRRVYYNGPNMPYQNESPYDDYYGNRPYSAPNYLAIKDRPEDYNNGPKDRRDDSYYGRRRKNREDKYRY